MAKIRIENVEKLYNAEQGFISRVIGEENNPVQAVSGVSMDVNEGEIIGIAGESGSGKTTLAKLLVKGMDPTSGELYYEDVPYSNITGKALSKFRREVQMILQDPYDSLNPRYTVLEQVLEPLKIHDIGDSFEERRDIVIDTLNDVGLAPATAYLDSFASDLSGGERQRVSIARSLVLNPDVLIADEPVSMLDVSIRAGVLNLLKRIHQRENMTIVVIGHDLAMMRYLTDKLGIMYLGEVVEFGDTEQVIADSQHPYTKELLKAVPDPTPETRRTRVQLEGEPPTVQDPPSGCRFHTRCPYAREACKQSTPTKYDTGGDDGYATCFRLDEDHKYWDSELLEHAKEDDEK